MRFKTKLFTALTSVVFSFISACGQPPEKVDYNPDKDIPDESIIKWVEQNLESIMENQEKAHDINHFGMPIIDYKGCGRNGNRVYYTPDTDTLTLFAPRHAVYFSKVTTREILMHELGHFYADKLSENHGCGSWPDEPLDKIEQLIDRTLNEGIAEYFLRGSEDESIHALSWPTSYEEAESISEMSSSLFFYNNGYLLVRPIISKFGKQGIIYLITHPPKKEEILDLPGYQQRVLKTLSSLES